MEQRTGLLERWSDLAPGECVRRTPEGLWAFNQTYAEYGTYGFPALLLSALIDAIRARGWHYSLESDKTTDDNNRVWHKAYVIRVWGNRHQRERAYADEPCDALLVAYCKALEATEVKSGS